MLPTPTAPCLDPATAYQDGVTRNVAPAVVRPRHKGAVQQQRRSGIALHGLRDSPCSVGERDLVLRAYDRKPVADAHDCDIEPSARGPGHWRGRDPAREGEREVKQRAAINLRNLDAVLLKGHHRAAVDLWPLRRHKLEVPVRHIHCADLDQCRASDFCKRDFVLRVRIETEPVDC
eukprot:983425-Rhodomonas_salina.1